MSSETWAIVAATALGPILAVIISLWREERSSIRHRRLSVFRILMSTRQVGISRDHVNALNLVEVDFYHCEKVQQNWKEYKKHLFNGGLEDESWRETKERLLANMLFEMAAALNFNIPALDIFKGGYAPKGWAHRDNLETGVLEYLSDLSKGASMVPIWVHTVPPEAPPTSI